MPSLAVFEGPAEQEEASESVARELRAKLPKRYADQAEAIYRRHALSTW